ncbi:MAG TPA: class I tRNA ligase family protein, partial [Gammaproteobacteria bacterium]
DVIKDRLYTTPADSLARRSAQTAMSAIAESMVRWLSPILSFTAEEIWRELPGEREASVFLATWRELPELTTDEDVDWGALLTVRQIVSRELERLRVAGAIGAPLDAEVRLYCDGDLYDALAILGEELRFVFITSAASVHPSTERPEAAVAAEEEGMDLWITVAATEASKCVRCWHRRDDVGSVEMHPELCARCVANVEGGGETRRYA